MSVLESAATAVEEGYRACEAVTRARAGNFYYGIRLLPAPKRRGVPSIDAT